MATKTKNYNLIKPELTDDADVRVINGNMDVLDAQLKTVADSVTSGNKNAYTTISVSSDYTWTFTKGSGANVSYDTIKKAISADGIRTVGSYKPNVDSTKYSQLQYHFGTIPNKGSTTSTIDCGTLKFNHWGASPFNAALSVPNNSGNRPFLSYQNGTAGTDYTTYKELAWKTDADAKLDKTGGTLTGTLYTSDSIFKSSNNGVLQIGGSTDGSHGARINLSGEKQLDAGLVKITADNGTNSNVFAVSPEGAGSKYTFNGLTTYMNSSDDYFRLGGNDAYFRLSKSNKQLLTNAGGLNINGIDCTFNTATDYFKFGTTNNYLAFNKRGKLYFSPNGTKGKLVPCYDLEPVQTGKDWNTENTGYMKTNDGLLIQWGVAVGVEYSDYFNRTLPQPYGNRKYSIFITHRHAIWNDTRTNADNRILADVVDGQTIRLCSDGNMIVQWMTIGKVD